MRFQGRGWGSAPDTARRGRGGPVKNSKYGESWIRSRHFTSLSGRSGRRVRRRRLPALLVMRALTSHFAHTSSPWLAGELLQIAAPLRRRRVAAARLRGARRRVAPLCRSRFRHRVLYRRATRRWRACSTAPPTTRLRRRCARGGAAAAAPCWSLRTTCITKCTHRSGGELTTSGSPTTTA